MRSFLRVAWNVSQQALSKQSPVLPIETSIPALTQRLVNSTAVYCSGSTGPRNSACGRDCTSRE